MLDLAGKHELARDLVAGGVFVPGCTVALNEECELVVRSAERELHAHARRRVRECGGAGLQLVGCDAELKQRIAALASPPPTEEPPPAEAQPAADDAESDAAKQRALNIHERLRGLTLVAAAQGRAATARSASASCSSACTARTCGRRCCATRASPAPRSRASRAWAPCPARCSSSIVGNGAWLQIPEVRRALLSNPRLGVDQIMQRAAADAEARAQARADADRVSARRARRRDAACSRKPAASPVLGQGSDTSNTSCVDNFIHTTCVACV